MNSSADAEASSSHAVDSGLQALCGIAAYYRIAADPAHIRRELALGGRAVAAQDIVRAAQIIGLKARIIENPEKRRVAELPAPSIVRLRGGGFHVFGGKLPSGDYRLVDPITRVDRALSLDHLFDEMQDEAILVSRKIGGAGVDPQTFGFRWFLPSIWRYRRPLGHVLLASFFVQIFALVTPLFFQVVIDKVLRT
ncbi:cysteine peptidase family C39 domain-containing protein [Methylosinus sp. Ce-a6]|uniref:cysteine peptidase family C39 domain-containing protein n=1 Tax=Methylosinus sp. Ce-a6 TaxID=2172005 RepID=UPI001358A34F|nr:cysteine peptidase family C39 domain-containing protein [Methylosinus sp. Ce-a6]